MRRRPCRPRWLLVWPGKAGRVLSARHSSQDFSGGKGAPWEDSAGRTQSWEDFSTGWAVPR